MRKSLFIPLLDDMMSQAETVNKQAAKKGPNLKKMDSTGSGTDASPYPVMKADPLKPKPKPVVAQPRPSEWSPVSDNGEV